ncbi:MAG: glycosyltransferase family 39 protein [Henriciella sp.]|nr:glycosyltransferase family 39 protein [Henriciella sp.]
MTSFRLPEDPPIRTSLAIISGLLLFRLVLVVASPLELYADEAQYWRWGETLEWGYYSKPPMIAWLIHLSTAIFGESEWAIRLFAPILHTIAALVLMLLSRQMFGSKAALITVVAYLVMPGIVLSSAIISTDGVLFPFWCLALYLFWQLRERRAGWLSVVGLGVAIGCGFLSKYAMAYFGIGMALTMLLDRPTRQAMLSLKGAAVIAIAAAVLAPHLAWNAANSFQTVGHTVDNANLGGDLFNLENLPDFLADQLGIFGPVSFLGLLAGLVFVRARPGTDTAARETWLACFIVPVLVIIAFQSVVSRAHANWAATAYPAASVLIASIFLRLNTTRRTWLIIAAVIAVIVQIIPDFTAPVRLGIGLAAAATILGLGAVFSWRSVGLFWSGVTLHVILAAVFGTLSLGPPSWVAALGLDNVFKRTRGWQDLANQLVIEAEKVQPSAILVDEREVWHGLDYYTRGRLDTPLILWRYNDGIKAFAETQPLTDDIDDQVLVASYRANRRPRMQADFQTWEGRGLVGVDLGHRSNGCPLRRELRLYQASDYQPLARTREWVERFEGQELNALPKCPT